MCGRPSPRKGCHAVQCRGVVGEGSWGALLGEQPDKVGDQFIQPGYFSRRLNSHGAPPCVSAVKGAGTPHCPRSGPLPSLRRADWRHAPLQGRVGSLAVGRSLGGRGCWGEPGEALRVNGAGDKTGDRNSSVLTSFATERIHANGPNPSTVTTNSASVATASTRCCCIVHIRPGPRLLVLDLPSHLLRHFDTPVPCTLLIASSPQAVIVANPRTTQRPTTTLKTREAGHNNPPPTTPTTRQKDALPPTPERLPDSATCTYTSTTTTSCPA